jgi:hypothetical protein
MALKSIAVDNVALTEGEGYHYITSTKGTPALHVPAEYLKDECTVLGFDRPLVLCEQYDLNSRGLLVSLKPAYV